MTTTTLTETLTGRDADECEGVAALAACDRASSSQALGEIGTVDAA